MIQRLVERVGVGGGNDLFAKTIYPIKMEIIIDAHVLGRRAGVFIVTQMQQAYPGPPGQQHLRQHHLGSQNILFVEFQKVKDDKYLTLFEGDSVEACP